MMITWINNYNKSLEKYFKNGCCSRLLGLMSFLESFCIYLGTAIAQYKDAVLPWRFQTCTIYMGRSVYWNKHCILAYKSLGPLLLTWFNPFILTWVSNYIHYKVWDEITYPFPNFNGAAVEVWEWISNFTPHCWAYDYLTMLRFKLIHVSKRGLWSCFTRLFSWVIISVVPRVSSLGRKMPLAAGPF